MRDAKEALRRHVDVLEEELAAKDAEIAWLKAEQRERDQPRSKTKSKSKTRAKPKASHAVEPLDPRQVRIGKLLPDGTVRYVVRPIEWLWVVIMACVGGLISGVALFDDGGERARLLPLVFGLLPFLVTWNAGVDVDPQTQRMRVWSALGAIRVTRFTVPRVVSPRVGRQKTEKGVWCALYWGNNHVRTTLKPDELGALVTELGRLAKPSKKRS